MNKNIIIGFFVAILLGFISFYIYLVVTSKTNLVDDFDIESTTPNDIVNFNLVDDDTTKQVVTQEIPKDWKQFSNQNLYISFKYNPSWELQSYGGGPNQGSTLNDAVSQKLNIEKYRTATVYDFSTDKSKTKIILPKTQARESYSSTLDNITIGMFIIELRDSIVDILDDQPTKFLSFEFSVLVDKNQAINYDRQSDLEIFKKTISSIEFKKPISEAEQLKAMNLCKDTQKNGVPPKFDEYKVSEIYKGPSATLDLSDELARGYKTRFNEALKLPPNFAGHYSAVGWGCGSNCPVTAFVDHKTGKTYGTWGAVESHVDSSLFIDSDVDLNPGKSKAVVKYFNMTDVGAKFICSEIVPQQQFN